MTQGAKPYAADAPVFFYINRNDSIAATGIAESNIMAIGIVATNIVAMGGYK